MSVDHFSPRSSAVSEKDPLFLHVKAGMTVVVSEGEDWWIGDTDIDRCANRYSRRERLWIRLLCVRARGNWNQLCSGQRCCIQCWPDQVPD